MTRKPQSNFVKDRELFDLVRSATGFVLTPTEVDDLLAAGVERDRLCGLLHGYRKGGEAAAVVDEALRPILAKRQTTDAQSSRSGDAGAWGEKLRIFARNAALVVESSETSAGEPTLSFDAAVSAGRDGRDFCWDKKLVFQLSAAELSIFACVVLGLLTSAEFKNHGAAHDKVMSVEHQGSNLFIKVQQRNRPLCAVPVDPAQAFELSALACRRLAAANRLSVPAVVALLGRTTARMAAAQSGGPAA